MSAREAAAAGPGGAIDGALRRLFAILLLLPLLPKLLLTGLLILAIADMVAGVFLRYVMVPVADFVGLEPINFFWVEETGEYTLAWLTMVGAGVGIAERAHFTLRVLTHRLPLAAQRAIHVASHLLIAAFGALAGLYGVQLAIVNSMLTSPALDLNLAWLYASAGAGGALIVLYGLAAALAPPPQTAADALDAEGAIAAGDD